MCLEKWESALSSFRKVVSLNHDDGQAWNNIGTIQCKLGKNAEAMNSFKFALKTNYESWKMWDNYLTSTLSVGNFVESITALERLVEIPRDEAHPLSIGPFEVIFDGICAIMKVNGNEEQIKERSIGTFKSL